MSETDEDMLNGKHLFFGNLEMLDVYGKPTCQTPTSTYFLMQKAACLFFIEAVGLSNTLSFPRMLHPTNKMANIIV